MCNLYTMDAPVAEIARTFGVANDRINLPDFGDIYPKQEAPIVRADDGRRVIDRLTWGFDFKGRNPGTNVRNLTNSFWLSMLREPARRCLVPVTRFCEWEGEKGSKRKVWFGLKDVPLFAFAGIWRPADDGARMAFLTCDANEIVGAVHPKAMPVILTGEAQDAWLTVDWDEAQQLAKPYPDDAMEIVSRG